MGQWNCARPGGNITGPANQQRDLSGKRLEDLREIVPGLRRIAVMANVDNAATRLEIEDARSAAQKVVLDLVLVEIRQASDIEPSFELIKQRADALYVVSDPFLSTHRSLINSLALGARIPTLHGLREYVEAGGLMSYGPKIPKMFRRAADLVDKILRGENAGDIPVEQPTEFDLVINLRTEGTGPDNSGVVARARR